MDTGDPNLITSVATLGVDYEERKSNENCMSGRYRFIYEG